jgi:hypothetical protein
MDSLRARVVKVRGARVVAYCSEECAHGVVRAPEPVLASPPVPESVPQVTSPLAAALELAPTHPAHRDAEPDLTPLPVPDRQEPIARPLPDLAARQAPRPSSRTGRRFVAVAILALALVGLAIVGARSLGRSAPSHAAPPPAPASPAVPAQGPSGGPSAPTESRASVDARVERGALAVESRALLARYLGDSSGRIRLLAALALARTKDEAAMAELRRALAEEPSEIRRVEIAFVLARTGDAEGTEYLARALGHSRRDVRLQAARLLARLGDARGKDRLKEAMSLPNQRLGAAETLAMLGDEGAVLALKEALARGGQEMRMRAAVGLGRAGDASGVALLREMVAERRVELGAADALARLGDPASVPALTRALELTAMRVDAALTLRCLGVEVDFRPLGRVLIGGDDLGQISAAEAVLVLADPNVLAEPRECRSSL